MADGRPSVFTIPPGLPFLPTLADALMAGDLVPFDRDPLALAGLTVLLPTRRAARELREVLLDRLGGEAMILPRIRPLGDIDDEAVFLTATDGLSDAGALLAEAVSPLDRRLTLTELALAWAEGVERELLQIDDDEDLAIPASAADAARLAGALERLLDDVESAGIGWEALRDLPEVEQTAFFDVTLDFLGIVAEAWPTFLAEIGREDPTVQRDRMLHAEAQRWTEGRGGPVVAAGSTGSIPATAALLRAVAQAPAGALVLPGLDLDLDAAGWAAVDDEVDAGPAVHGHPQFGLKRLIASIGIERADVAVLGRATPVATARGALLSETMRPSATSEAWADHTRDLDVAGALDGISLALARNEQEEALVAAVAMREAVETDGVTAALVTPDRHLAARVAAELARWGLSVDDSAGRSLADDAAGRLCRLVAAAADPEVDAVTLLALLRHPLVSFGMAPSDRFAAVEALELATLRGQRFTGGIAGLPDRLGRQDAALPRSARDPERRQRAVDFAGRVRNAFAPLLDCHDGDGNVALADLATRLGQVIDAVADHEALAKSAGGEALATLLETLVSSPAAARFELRAAEFAGLLDVVLSETVLPRPPGADPRLHIWGVLEARLQTADLLILGGLDEGVWPASPRTDPWLSRTMRAELGLPPPERRLGLAAHDFVQAFAQPNVLCTRALKRGGAPTIEARWLQRLRAVVGEDGLAPAAARGERLIALARLVDRPVGTLRPVGQPAPTPPLAARPDTLSITEIETLIRDPYAVYAKRVLDLRPLDPIGLAHDRALRGTLFHESLGRFTQAWEGPHDEAALEHLTGIASEVLEGIADAPELHAIWTARFHAIAEWLIAWEADRDALVERRYAEIDGRLEVGPVTLKGRADRIDLMRDGSLAIYDFKTTSPPTARQVYAGLSPQMTLEAAVARAGGFDPAFRDRSVSALAWLALGRVGRSEVIASAVKRGETADALADRALSLFTDLVDAYASPEHGYRSRARPLEERTRFQGDYDHLARAQEWSLLESDDDYR